MANASDPIRELLLRTKTIAVVGLSSDPMRPSFGVSQYMQRKGYRIIPVNPNEGEVLGAKAYKTLVDVPDKIDMVDVFRRPEFVPEIVDEAKEIWRRADLVVKVKEPLPAEWPLLRKGQMLFTYFHFAADRALTDAVMQSGITAIAYETIRDRPGNLPLLTPMSEVAGRMSIQEGAKFLERPFQGRGILLGGVPGVAPANVGVLGGGIVGANAGKVAAGLGANVIILDINLVRLRYLDDVMPPNVTTVFSDRHNILESTMRADLIIGAVLIPGARAPFLIRREDLKGMVPRAVIVDVAIDQGGCVETSRPTTHSKPTYIVDDVVHYCVANMPGAVGRTGTYALTNVALPYVLQLANKGVDRATRDNPALAAGVNIRGGRVTNPAVAATFGLECAAVA